MRCFVAIDMVPDIGHRIAEIQKKLSKEVKLVEPEHLHFTLRFLGEISDEKARQVEQVLRSVEYPRFDIELDKIGGFPSPKKARIIWLGIRHEQDARGWNEKHSNCVRWNILPSTQMNECSSCVADKEQPLSAMNNLVIMIEEKLTSIGIPKADKEFSAHLTIARAKQPVNIDSLKDMLENSHVSMVVDSFSLKQSTLTAKGPVYKDLVRIGLV
ncbi:MAG: RNA 2',3'-cyclic phosphodiesterase [Candidatus Aenigmatarchaeota archaeon]